MRFGKVTQAEQHLIFRLELHIHGQFAMQEGIVGSFMAALLWPIYIVMMLAFI